MNTLVRLLLFAVLVSFPSLGKAQETQRGQGMVCDTPTQLKQLAALHDQQISVEEALKTVNTDKETCAPVRVLFVQGKVLETVKVGGRLYDIVEILVVGVLVGEVVMSLTPMVQYTAVPSNQQEG